MGEDWLECVQGKRAIPASDVAADYYLDGGLDDRHHKRLRGGGRNFVASALGESPSGRRKRSGIFTFDDLECRAGASYVDRGSEGCNGARGRGDGKTGNSGKISIPEG